MLLVFPRIYEELSKGLECFDEAAVIDAMEDSVWKPVANGIIRAIRENKSVDVGAILDELSEGMRARLSAQLIDSDYSDPNVRVTTLEDCVHKIAERARRHHNRAVLAELRKREQLGIELTPADELAAWRPRNRSDA